MLTRDVLTCKKWPASNQTNPAAATPARYHEVPWRVTALQQDTNKQEEHTNRPGTRLKRHQNQVAKLDPNRLAMRLDTEREAPLFPGGGACLHLRPGLACPEGPLG